LIRSYWPVTDVAAGSEQMIQLHTSGVVAIDFRYRDAVGQWHPRWPVDGTNERLPSAIEYRLQSRSFGEIRRLLVL
ncbi:MAG: type II secretion system protein GspJ, partial [Pseudomonadota bacterium]